MTPTTAGRHMLPPVHTLGLLALRIGCQVHHLQRLCARRLIPFAQAGRIRLVADADVPAVIEACRQRGYIVAPAGEEVGGAR